MINLNENHSCSKDHYGWELRSYFDSEDKKGNPIRSFKRSYYGKFEHVLNQAIDVECGGCESLEELRSLLLKAGECRLDVITKKEKLDNDNGVGV